MNADWFYSVGDSRQGPVTEEDLKRLVADGRLKPTDLVWKDGMPDWVEARTVPVLFPPPKVEALAHRDDRPSRRGGDDYDDDRSSRRGRDEYDDDRPSRRGRDEYDDDRPSRRGRDDDDRPSRRGRRRDDDQMDDDRPRVRRRDDDYDDDYDRPRKKKNEKPGQVQAVAIMMLVGGALGLLLVLGLGIAAIPTVVCCFWPGLYYQLVVGILMIIRGVNMLNQDDQGPPRTLAILQIICIANLDIINCVMGIVAIIMIHDPKVEDYYRKRGFI